MVHLCAPTVIVVPGGKVPGGAWGTAAIVDPRGLGRCEAWWCPYAEAAMEDYPKTELELRTEPSEWQWDKRCRLPRTSTSMYAGEYRDPG
jgi:hypothetical protein